MNIENIELIELVAKGLGELKDEVVFLGGMVTFLYANDAYLSDIRPTKDIDCIVEVHSKMDYATSLHGSCLMSNPKTQIHFLRS